MGSSRFPGKSVEPLLGRPMLERMIERVKHSRCIDGIVVATTDLPEDDVIESLAERIGVGSFRGSAHDVLGRLAEAARCHSAGLVVVLLGDNPLVHAELIDDVVAFHNRGRFDYAATATTEHPYAGAGARRFPIGVRVEVFARAVLDRCARLASEPRHREHSTSFIYGHPELFRLGYFEADGNWSEVNRPELTFAVNYPENHELIQRIFERCYPTNPNFPLSEVVNVFDSDPTLACLMGAPL
jgi:spore coat polysaccharide biosynthesis protein SpsF